MATKDYIAIIAVVTALAFVRSLLAKRRRMEGFFRAAGILEIAVIGALLLALVSLGSIQIILRNFFHRGLIWADPLMRHMVLWIGCLGGALASSRMQHINIDVFTRLLANRAKRYRDRIVFSITSLAATFLGISSLKLLMDERAYGEKAFLGLSTWELQAVLPFAFFLIAYRSLFHAFNAGENGKRK